MTVDLDESEGGEVLALMAPHSGDHEAV